MSAVSQAVQVCFVGDSFVAGIGDETALGWTGRLAALQAAAGNSITAYNLGIRRNTSADIVARCAAEVGQRRSAARETRVVLSLGVNDTTHEGGQPRVHLEESCVNLERLLDSLAGDSILVVGPPAVADDAQNVRIGRLSTRFHQLCRGRGIPFIEVFQILEQHPVWRQQVLADDGAHPQSEGYTALFELIVPTWARWMDDDGGGVGVRQPPPSFN